MINIKNLTFAYKKGHNVLEDVSLTLSDGHIHGLLGKNGAGKTTLEHLMAGLLFPDEGTIEADGFIPKERRRAFLQDIYFLGDEVPGVNLTIETYAKINSVFYSRFSMEDFRKYLEMFEITDTGLKINKLSLGTRKKVYISFCLACNTKYVLMDEPTNGLDIPSKSTFRKVMQLGMTEEKNIIISTHQARDLQNILDSIVILDKNRILMSADTDEITDKLWFGICPSPVLVPVLYQEDSAMGVQVVRLNEKKEECNLDVEMLFNAAFTSRQTIEELFKKE